MKLKKNIKKKVLFVLPTLTAGGAERVISFVSQNISKNKYDAKLLITGYSKDSVFDISQIEVKFLEKSRVLYAVPKLFIYLFKHKPEIIVSSIGHLNTIMGLMSLFFRKSKFIIREASVISVMNAIQSTGQKKVKSINLHNSLSIISYRLVDGIICQSKDMANDFIEIYNVSKDKVHTINNPITYSPNLKKGIKMSFRKPIKFVTVGRLSKEKGHLRIIEMLSKLDYSFHYTVIGDGPLRTEILKRIEDNNLMNSFTHIPYTDKVFDFLSKSDLFLQGSYVEGFPNAVLESCMAGTPVLAFNVPGGTKEIIKNGINGYLVESAKDFFNYLNKEIDLEPAEVRKTVEEKFSTVKIINEYELLFDKL